LFRSQHSGATDGGRPGKTGSLSDTKKGSKTATAVAGKNRTASPTKHKEKPGKFSENN